MVATVLAVVVCLIFSGGGCQDSAADRVAGEAVNGMIRTPLKALDQAKELTQMERARAALDAESVANEMTVAMILPDGVAAPAGIEPGETVGCNDRVAYAKVPRESDSGDTLKDVLNSLFAVRETTYGGLHNSLALSRLSVEKIQSRDGVNTEVWLKGSVSSSGACDDPRVKAQIEFTVKRLKPAYKIFLNGSEDEFRCIGDMSGLCGQD